MCKGLKSVVSPIKMMLGWASLLKEGGVGAAGPGGGRGKSMGGMSHMQELGIGTLLNSRGEILQGSKQKK